MKKRKKSQKSWREFEELVARIESALCPRGAIVKSPDRIMDNITQQLREVDASIRYKVGTTEILIMIECRERKKSEDAMWIEQLASKQRHVGAAKCIAVTSNVFTAPAIKKAKALGIELRHVNRIDEKTILEWAPIRTWFYNYTLKYVELGFAHDGNIELNQSMDDELNEELRKKFFLEDDLLQSKVSDKKISLRKYVEDTLNLAYNEMSDIDKLKIEENKEYIFSTAGDPQYYVECSKGQVDVIGVAYKIIFHSFVDYSLKATAAFNYSDDKSALVEGLEFDVNSRDGKKEKITIHKDLTSNVSTVSRWDVEES